MARINISFRSGAPNSYVVNRNVKSLADAVEQYHRTGVFDLRASDIDSYDFPSDKLDSRGLAVLDSSLLDVSSRCEDLMIAASIQMSREGKERQVANIVQSPAKGVASDDGTVGS